MKKLLSLLICLVFAHLSYAQSPQKMSYQSVIRDAAGELVVQSLVGIQISIIQGSFNGTAVYVETHSPITNVNGLASIEIGTGAIVSDSFSSIDWSNGPYFIRSETDPEGGTNYILNGTSELLSVPYAFYAENSGSDGFWNKTGDDIFNDNSGNVGIGTDSPNGLLDVRGASRIKSLLVGDNVGSDDSGARSMIIRRNPLQDIWLSLQSDNGATNEWEFRGNADGDLRFLAGFDQRLTLQQGGNMGIGTDFPDATLHILGTMKLQDGNQGSGKVLTSDSDGLASWQTLAGVDNQWLSNGNDIYLSTIGNVGIGTSTPSEKLTLESGEGEISAFAVYRDTKRVAFIGDGSGGGESGTIYLGNNEGITTHRFLANGGANYINAGNLGIGTSSPGYKLDVRGNVRIGDGSSSEQDIEFSSGSGGWQVGTNNSGNGINSNQFYIYDNGYRLTVQKGSGNVGIGTTTPQSKLAVNGKISCKEVEVTLAGFPDYVFDADYKLMSLKEIEAYIALNGHLPNVPSAEEVEENGLGLGEMNKILLEKVEELTLHAIESEKRIAQLEDLLKRVSALESRIQ